MKYLSKLLSMLLVGAMLYSTGCTDCSQDVQDLNNRLDELVQNEIDPLKANLEETKTALNAALTEANEALEAHQKDLDDLKKADVEATEKINEALDAIDKLEKADDELGKKIDAAVEAVANANEKIQALETADVEFQKSIDALSSSVATLSGDVDSLKEWVMQANAWMVNVDGQISTLSTKIETIESSIATLESSIATLEETKLDVTTFEEYKAEAAGLFTALAAADEALETLISTTAGKIREEIEAYKGVVTAEFENAYAEIAKNTTAINSLATELATKYAELKAKDEALAKTDEEIKADIVKINAAIVEIKADLAAYKAEVNQRLLNAEGHIGQLQVAVQGLTDKLNEFKAAYDAHITDYNAFVENTKKALDTLGLQVETIINRIQSIVYRPNYADGKLSIDYATFGKNTIVEGRSTAEYNVYPAEGALAIANAFADGKATVKFDVSDELKTRAAAPEFTVVDVQNTESGRIAVTFVTRGLSDKFYQRAADAENYAISLVVDLTDVEAAADANLSTSFTNIIGGEHSAITMDIVYNGAVVTGNNEVYVDELIYTQWETTPNFISLPGYFLQYTFEGQTYTAAELVEFGYEEVKPVYTGTVVEHEHVSVYDVPNADTGYNEQNLDITALDATLVDREFNLVYTYGYSNALGEESVTAGATLKVLKEQASIVIPEPYFTINWTYLDDASVDAALLGVEDDQMALAQYTRELSFALADAVVEKLPNDTTFAQLFANEPAKIIVNGKELTQEDAIAIALRADETKGYISFVGFDWDSTYEVVVKYSLANVDVNVSFAVQTVDRSRKVIELELKDEQWMLTKDFLYESETASESLDIIYNTVKADLGQMSAEAFLKDIFVTREFVASKNFANGEAEENTKLVIVNDGAKIKSVYNINDYDVIPEAVKYVYNITTWYGQEIVITKTLNIGLIPVEIKLADESRKLVKDLEFYTDAESLAAIYENVTNVDKANITAGEYLAAIFAEPKFRALRAQEDLANGVKLANTKLVVAPKDGATAKAAYNFADFDVTPKSVVYQSTYTTWYGQVIIINKTVNIDWTTYNYYDVPEWVYNVNGSGYYSNAIPYRVNNPEGSTLLESIVISLDMDTAFLVGESLENGGYIDVTDKLKELGLASKFDFSNAPTDKRIKFMESSNNLYYHGHDKSVGVKAQLTLKNSNGVETILPTNFDEGEKYADYIVMQYNPVGKLKADNLNIRVAPIAKQYTYFAMNQLELVDDRQHNLIAHGSLEKNSENEIKYYNGNWVVGDDQNGFFGGAKVEDIYGLKVTKFSCTGIPESLSRQLLFNETTGELYFNNWNSIELTTPIKLTITVDITHYWANDTVSFNVTLYNK